MYTFKTSSMAKSTKEELAEKYKEQMSSYNQAVQKEFNLAEEDVRVKIALVGSGDVISVWVMMEVDYKELSKEALEGVLDDFVLREGTDYGEQEYTREQKRAQVLEQLKQGKVKLVWDAESETTTKKVSFVPYKILFSI